MISNRRWVSWCVESCGRFVHDHNARLERESAGDIDDLLDGRAEVAHGGVDRRRRAKPAPDLLRLAKQGFPVDDAGEPFDRLISEHDVLRDGQCRHDRPLLMDHRDAEILAFRHAVDDHADAFDANLAGVRPQHAGEHLDQRALARAVFADDGVNFAGANGEVDPVDSADF